MKFGAFSESEHYGGFLDLSTCTNRTNFADIESQMADW